MLWLSRSTRLSENYLFQRHAIEMDPRNQAYIPRSQRGGHDQSFGEIDITAYGASANMASHTAQRVDWYDPRNATHNGVATLPGTYPRQTGTNTNFDSPQQIPKPAVTHES